MRVNGSELNSSDLPRDPPSEDSPRRPPWVTSTLAAILIFTIVVDLLGNFLVILSVYRNKKLRNAGKGRRGNPRASPGVRGGGAAALSAGPTSSAGETLPGLATPGLGAPCLHPQPAVVGCDRCQGLRLSFRVCDRAGKGIFSTCH